MGLLCGLGHYFHDSFPKSDWSTIITIGAGSILRHGWLDSPPSAGFGSSTEAGLVLNGETLAGVYSISSADFAVVWEDSGGILVQDDFTSVFLKDGNDILRQYDTADANFGNFGSFTIWTWNFGGDQAWKAVDVDEEHAVGILL